MRRTHHETSTVVSHDSNHHKPLPHTIIWTHTTPNSPPTTTPTFVNYNEETKLNLPNL